MTLYEFYIVFPEGEEQEISHTLTIGCLVDINGNTIPLPLKSTKIIAYQISGKRTFEERGIHTTKYFLEQLNARELLEYV